MNEAELRSLLAKYIQAEADLLSGKSITWGSRQISRESLSEIRRGRHEIEQRIAQLNPRLRSRPQYSLSRFE